MTDWPLYLISFVAGIALGIIFFGGLWLTVRKAMTSKRPAIWFIFSLLIRSALVIGGIYWAAGQQWQRILVSLSGFILSRVLVLYVTKRYDDHKAPAKEGDQNESDLG
jgi:F1F0 ATPase subunit 2